MRSLLVSGSISVHDHSLYKYCRPTVKFFGIKYTKKYKKAKKVMISQTFACINGMFAQPSKYGHVIQ